MSYPHWFAPSVIAVLLSCGDALAQSSETSIIVENDVRVTTRAGFDVSANVYRPDREGQFPAIISMGPYGKDDLPVEYDGLFSNGQIMVSEYAAFETPDPEFWTHYGYVVIAADTPGSGLSEGDLDLWGPIESEAFYDVIEWAAAQSWSNGSVGLSGESYFGMSQWYVAALNPPSLKAINPGEALTDIYRDAVQHGGILADFVEPWTQYRILPAKRPDAEFVRNVVEELAAHPLYDEFWAGWEPDLAAIAMPAYVIASWPDHGLHTRGTLLGFEHIGSENKWLEIHGRKKWEYYYSRESLERQRRFFDRYLKDADNGWEEVPTVRYERRNAFYDGEIRHADDWPIPGADHRVLFLTPDGLLDESLPDESRSLRYTATDQNEQLAFRHVFENDTEITGSARLTLWVEADGADDMDLFVGLSKLDRNGTEVQMPGYNDTENGHVASGWLRVSHRDVNPEKSTPVRPYLRHDRPMKLELGERVRVDVEILPSSTMFRAGESLVVRVQGTELPGAGDIEHVELMNSGDHIVYVGGDTGSRLTVPVIVP
ncbi:MAG: CocE/NonD family hydrolase [Gammaproteobacteria bacterium]